MKKRKKAVIVSIGSYGDFLPAVSFARDLQLKQIDVCMVGYSVFAPVAKLQGIEYHGVCSEQDYSTMTSLRGAVSGETAEYHHFMACGRGSIVPIFKLLLSLGAQSNLVVFTVGYCDGAVWACEQTHSPLVRLSYSPADLSAGFNHSVSIDPRHQYYESICRVHKSAIRKELCLKPYNGEDWHYHFDATACFYPRQFVEYGLQGARVKNVFMLGFPEGVPAIGSGAPLARKSYSMVYTCGSAFSPSGDELLRFTALCHSLGMEGLFVANNLSPEADTPLKNALASQGEGGYWVETVGDVDLPQVLARAKLIFHHGGIGTIKDALYAQVAQVVLPRAFDQFFNASMVQAMGFGVKMELPDFLANRNNSTVTAVKALLQKSPLIAARANSLRSPCQAGELERLVSVFRLAASAPVGGRRNLASH